MQIRRASPDDHPSLAQVMFRAIHDGDSPYTPAQRNAWCPTPPQGNGWQARLAAQHVFMAEDSTPLGFMTLRDDGYLDLAYILPEARGNGLFRRLYTRIEDTARSLGLSKIETHASLSAQAPFAAVGFTLIQHEIVTRADQTLPRAQMRKNLS